MKRRWGTNELLMCLSDTVKYWRQYRHSNLQKNKSTLITLKVGEKEEKEGITAGKAPEKEKNWVWNIFSDENPSLNIFW